MPLSRKHQKVVDAFHYFFYTDLPKYKRKGRSCSPNDVRWLGTEAMKPPFDLFVYQEIIWDTRPDLIIECGTSSGGTTLFLATICELIRYGNILTIDKVKYDRPPHPAITYLMGDTLSPEVLNDVIPYAKQRTKVMVILDDNHSRDHVLAEMELYGALVTSGCYLIVEDTNVNGHPVFPNHGPGPAEAVSTFLRKHKEFKVDREREHFGLTYNPGGYLLRR
jgi:cephalosporin hydroxylase